MNAELVIVIIGAIFALLVGVGFAMPLPDPIATLKREYLMLMRLGREEGEAHLARRLEAIETKQPGRDLQFYLRWLVDDLRRSKRQ